MHTKVFVIEENSKGNFHLGNFGASTGGIDRNRPFVFLVLGKNGEKLAVSEVVSAKGLRIAERGRGDYDTDCYRQSHFFRKTRTGISPSSPLALKMKWTIFS